MIRINTKREPVRGEFAKSIRERMSRIQNGKLTTADHDEIERHVDYLQQRHANIS